MRKRQIYVIDSVPSFLLSPTSEKNNGICVGRVYFLFINDLQFTRENINPFESMGSFVNKRNYVIISFYFENDVSSLPVIRSLSKQSTHR